VPTNGPDEFSFSQNDQFLAIVFATGRPESDDDYPNKGSLRSSFFISKLFDITKCQEVKEFSELGIHKLGNFSNDSKFYDFTLNYTVIVGKPPDLQGSWRFNLITRKLTQL
jgi:hypothetical protein